jgi:hypothetical protein
MMNGSFHKSEPTSAPRVIAPKRMQISVQTIGTDLSYSLEVLNMSMSGLLLKWERSQSLPFIEKTIIEIIVDPNASILQAPVRYMGQVVRRVKKLDEPSGMLLGVKILQMDEFNRDLWSECVESCQSDSTLHLSVSKEILFNKTKPKK